ncbi:hypothetical protein SDC9_20852 [bioreactor metagenome]|uniref:Uncharacterized protein n=1 Tax=bioreactor metagenome TaxID=1076179 RepID=A0A644U824_9ZZZZ|nr:DUF2680 domain-containing protein [Negativicutes bacterium]
MMKSKKWLVALSVAGLIAASGVVMAATADKQAADNKRPCFSQKGDFVHRGDMKGFKQNHQALLDLLKIDGATFKSELKAGKTMAAIAQEQGVSEKQLTAFMTEKMTQRIDEGVKAGRIDTDRADKMKANMDQRISDMINGKARMHRGEHKRGPGMFQDAQLLDLLKVDAKTLRNEMKAGKTLVAVANEKGVSEQDLKALMVERMTQRIDEGVKAGRIDTDRADKMKANMDQRISDMINGKCPQPRQKHDPKPQV